MKRALLLVLILLLLAPASQAAPAPERENYIRFTVSGREVDFEITKCREDDGMIKIDGRHRNPLGSVTGYITLEFPAETAPGETLDTSRRIPNLLIVYTDKTGGGWYWLQMKAANGGSSIYRDTKCLLTVTDRADDWQWYEGTFDATLYDIDGNRGLLELTNGSFSVALGASAETGSAQSKGESAPAPAAPQKSDSRKCGVCRGSGVCPGCGGERGTRVPGYGGVGTSSWVTCKSCGGTGRCSSCGGTGRKTN